MVRQMTFFFLFMWPNSDQVGVLLVQDLHTGQKQRSQIVHMDTAGERNLIFVKCRLASWLESA